MSAGVRAMLTSALAFSAMSALVKLAGARLPSVEIALVRVTVALALSGWAVWRAGLPPWGRDRLGLLARGVLGFVGLHCYFASLTRLPLADATLIHLTSPLLVAVAAALFLGEPLRATDVGGMLLALLGVLLIARPTFLFGQAERSLDALGLAAAIGGALAGAGASVVVRKLRNTEHPLVVVLHFPLVAAPLTVPVALPSWVWPTAGEWLLLLGVGALTHVGQLKMTEGLHLEPAARATAVGYVQVLFTLVLGVVCFGETPTAWTLAGAVAVALGTGIVARQAPAAGSP